MRMVGNDAINGEPVAAISVENRGPYDGASFRTISAISWRNRGDPVGVGEDPSSVANLRLGPAGCQLIPARRRRIANGAINGE